MIDDAHRAIIQKILILFNVRPSTIEDTKIFKSIKQKELEDAFEYWLDQSKMVFGEVGKIIKTHSLKEAGIDLCLNLLQSGFKFGIQIKTFGDIQKKGFSKEVSSQRSQSLKHKLSNYLIAFAGDMTSNSQKQKIQGMVSELSQQGDDYVISLSPEKVLTIYNAYKSNQHPLKLVFLEYSEAVSLLNGVTQNLNLNNAYNTRYAYYTTFTLLFPFVASIILVSLGERKYATIVMTAGVILITISLLYDFFTTIRLADEIKINFTQKLDTIGKLIQAQNQIEIEKRKLILNVSAELDKVVSYLNSTSN